MRSLPVFTALCAACGQGSPSSAQPHQVETTGTYIHRGSGFSFPPAIGDFTRVSITQYNAEASDISAGYNLDRPGRQIAVTVYVYPAPAAQTGDAQQQACADQFTSIKSDIEHAHAGAHEITETAIRAPDPSYEQIGKKAVYEFADVFAGTERTLRSEAELFCYVAGPWFVAYRTTVPKGADYESALSDLMRQLRWPPTSKVASVR